MSSSRKSVLFFALAIGAVSVFIHGAVAENRLSPNVLLIAIDDLRPDLNCYGNSKMVTPRMDQFARSALIFEKASTRTRCAFEVAAYDQGAHVTYLGPSGSQMGTKETMKDFSDGLSAISLLLKILR